MSIFSKFNKLLSSRKYVIMDTYLQTNPKLIELFSLRNCQGASISKAKIIIFGEDANFDNSIFEDKEFCEKHLFPYLSDFEKYIEEQLATNFELNNYIPFNHPIQIDSYSGKGKLYHKNFRKTYELDPNLVFKKTLIRATSFCEVLPLPTLRKPEPKEFTFEMKKTETKLHLESIFKEIRDSKENKLIYIPPMAYKKLRRACKFHSINPPIPIYTKDELEEKLFKNPCDYQGNNIYFSYHFSYRFHTTFIEKASHIFKNHLGNNTCKSSST